MSTGDILRNTIPGRKAGALPSTGKRPGARRLNASAQAALLTLFVTLMAFTGALLPVSGLQKLFLILASLSLQAFIIMGVREKGEAARRVLVAKELKELDRCIAPLSQSLQSARSAILSHPQGREWVEAQVGAPASAMLFSAKLAEQCARKSALLQVLHAVPVSERSKR